MKGYTTAEGYMGFVNGRYMLFASESEYICWKVTCQRDIRTANDGRTDVSLLVGRQNLE